MSDTVKNKILSVLTHYQATQKDGRKDVDSQIDIYSDDSVFISFTAAGVVGAADTRVLNGKKEIRQAFEDYNEFVKTFDKNIIEYFSMMVDVDALKGSFVMKIRTEKNGEIKQYLNYLQMQFNDELKVILSLNWQAAVSDSAVFAEIS